MMRDATILYLANVLAIAEADGAVSAPEEEALRDILRRVRADDGDLAAARALLQREAPYRLQALADPAENMRMIEDMVLISLADGHVSPYESRPLDAFLSQLGFVQADMDMIVQRVRTRLRSTPPPPPPPPLRREGGPMPAAPAGGHATAARPAQARRAEPPQPAAAPRPEERPSPPPPPQPAAAAQPRPEPGAAAAPVAACARRREASGLGACHCFGYPEGPLNPWGCRLLDMAWADGAPWLRLGGFRDDDTFVFDRAAIADRLRQRLAAVSGCPFLLAGFAEQALMALPSRATTAGRWRHHLASQTAVSAAVPVTIRTYRHGCGRQLVALADGLTPTDDRDARLMIRRTARRTGAPLDLARLDTRQGGRL